MKVGFIGYGNMAQAIAQGLTRAHAVDGNDIVACAAHFDKLERNIAAVGGTAMHTPQEVVAAADMVVVAIKPYQVEDVLAPMAGALADDSKMLVSLAAGWDLARYQTLFGGAATGIHIQCTIPNTPMAVAQGVLICENVNTLTPSQCQGFVDLFSRISLIEEVDTAHMGIAMCIAGCAPAFTDMYLEALGDAGVKYGLQRATAYRLAAKMIEGVGALCLDSGVHPGAMKDAGCSPGGTTIKGVAELENRAFRGAVISAVDAIEQG